MTPNLRTVARYETRISPVAIASEVAIVGDAHAAALVARALITSEAQEVVIALFLTNRNGVMGYAEVARGGLIGAEVDPRVVFRAACLAGAVAIVLAHNHPSGHAEPSGADRVLTRRLAAIGDLLGCPLVDHVIVASAGEVYSFAERSRSDLDCKVSL